VNPSSRSLVPFNKPFVAPAAIDNARVALGSGHQSGDGPWTSRATQKLAALTGHPGVLLTTSGTHALEMACMALDLRPGDEVVVPSFTFSSTATAPWRTGATVRFADVDPGTLSLTPETVGPVIGANTRAVIVVHYAGISDRPDELAAFLAERGIALIEDNAHGVGAYWDGRPLGSFGVLSAMSFHETKNLQCGEGGALGVNMPELVPDCEAIREKGTNRSSFFRGDVDKYTWTSPGSSFLPAEVLAAVLCAQIDSFGQSQAKRVAIWSAYEDGLREWAEKTGFGLPVVPTRAQHPAHLFHLIAPSAEKQAALIGHLRDRRVEAPFHYQPLHASPAGRRASGGATDVCPVSASISERLLRLPVYPELSDDLVDYVIESVRSFA